MIRMRVQCVAGVADIAPDRTRRELLPRYPNMDGVMVVHHSDDCGVAIDASGASIPAKTLRHIAQNPNFGGKVRLSWPIR
jgi:galactarate dehydratase